MYKYKKKSCVSICLMAFILMFACVAISIAGNEEVHSDVPTENNSTALQKHAVNNNNIIPIAAALAVGLTGLATALVQSRIGAAGVGALVEKPKMTGTVIMLVAIPETIVILGFVVAYLILT